MLLKVLLAPRFRVFEPILKAGTATITLTAETPQAVMETQTIKVTVTDPVISISAAIASGTGTATTGTDGTVSFGISDKGKTGSLTVTSKNDDSAKIKSYTVVSGNTSVVTVGTVAEATGACDITVAGVGETSLTITAYDGLSSVATRKVVASTTVKVKVTQDSETLTVKYDVNRDGTLSTDETFTASSLDAADVTTTGAIAYLVKDDTAANTLQITASSAAGRTITYKSSNSNIAVDNNGLVSISSSIPDSAFEDGVFSAAVTVSTPGVAGTKSTYASIVEIPIKVTNKATTTLKITAGETTLINVATPTSASAKKTSSKVSLSLKDKTTDTLTITSNVSDSFISAKVVDANDGTGKEVSTFFTYAAGTLTAKAVGSAYVEITAKNSANTYGDIVVYIPVEVVNTNIVNNITVSAPADKIISLNAATTTFQITAEAQYKNTLTYKLVTKNADGTYSAYTGSDLTINAATGLVTYNKAGGNSGSAYVEISGAANSEAIAPTTTYILVNYSGTKSVSDLVVAANKITVNVGETVSAGATSTQTLTYVSADESIATVGTDGAITGVKAGTTAITIIAAANDTYMAGEIILKINSTSGLAYLPPSRKN